MIVKRILRIFEFRANPSAASPRVRPGGEEGSRGVPSSFLDASPTPGGAIRREPMSFLSPSTFRAVLSPCIGVCMLDDDGLCMGCHRSSAEIARWLQMDDDERLRLMEHVLPQRQAQREA